MQKYNIWGEQIPYHKPGKAKADCMDLKKRFSLATILGWVRDVFGTKVTKDASYLDTFTYMDEIRKGKMSAYMDDVPNLTYFPAKGSDTGVIIAPGGAFCNQGRKREGSDVAEYLNRSGISAFVLEYRMNPYEAPVCYLDMQRAIRYVRYHADDFGLDRHKIGAMGFSAGGYVAGASEILLGNQPVKYPDYVPDEVDREEGRADFLGLIYPVTNFDVNPNMLCLLAGDDFFDPKKRPKLQKQYSLTAQMGPSGTKTPQFLCYGTKDMLKGMDLYAKQLKECGVPHKTVVLEGAGHGFTLSKKYITWAEQYVAWIKGGAK